MHGFLLLHDQVSILYKDPVESHKLLFLRRVRGTYSMKMALVQKFQDDLTPKDQLVDQLHSASWSTIDTGSITVSMIHIGCVVEVFAL